MRGLNGFGCRSADGNRRLLGGQSGRAHIRTGRRLRFLVTAGPTREFLDDVRFFSNASSGRMGYAVAAAASRAGHEVCLVSGPTAIEPPRVAFLTFVAIESAREMARAVTSRAARSNVVVMTAAVADYRPAHRIRGKIKKGPGTLVVKLVRNPDILAGLGRRKGNRILVGFALEASRGRARAERKLAAKNLDLIVLDSPATIGAERATVEMLARDGEWETHRGLSKRRVGEIIVKKSEALAEAAGLLRR
ncbi:MAG: phosphopantothenoylcysteine decarboxylase [Planctomycetes bacterium]|nr:phosphopantothenoylcysteine decarboxylase [Planctomycetota bacterium]MBI3847046.1 phosphopantothenoylcysteine decarboxylase [Planctomycetota bacterium]